MCPIVFQGHPSNFKVTQAEKSTIWIQFEIIRRFAAIKSLRFALLRSNIEIAISQLKMVQLSQTEKANISIELYASNMTIRFDLGYDLHLEFSRANMEFARSQLKMVRLTQNEKQAYQLNSRPQMWPICLTVTMTLTFQFSRTNVTLTFDLTHGLDHG